MEFLRIVEDDLRALSVEARRKHPMVKEAAERGIVKTRALREQYAAAVRESGESPPIGRLRSQDLLRPFLLACNHTDCGKPMILQALGAIGNLINRDAISPSDAPNIVRVLVIQALAPGAVPDVQVKVLQTLLLTVTWRSCELPEDVLASALVVCVQLWDHRHATIRNAASATLRQIISLMVDRVGPLKLGSLTEMEEVADEEGLGAGSQLRREGSQNTVGEEEDLDWSQAQSHKAAVKSERGGGVQGEPEELKGLRPVERCAYLLIQDLCLLSRGEQPTWIRMVKPRAVPPTLGLELIEQIISQRPRLFREVMVFTKAVRSQVCPLIVQTLRSSLDFPLLVRLMRAVNTVLGHLADLLVPQMEVILAMLLQLIASSVVMSTLGSRDREETMVGAALTAAGVAVGGTAGRASKQLGLWSATLALDVLSSVCQSAWLVHTAFHNYDLEPECTNVLASLIKGLTRFVIEGSACTAATQSLNAVATSAAWSDLGMPSLVHGFELMKESSPPSITDGEVLLDAVGAVLALVDTLCRMTLDMAQSRLSQALPSSAMCHQIPTSHSSKDAPGFQALFLQQIMTKEDVWKDLVHFFHQLFSQTPSSEKLFDGILLGFERLCITLGILDITAAKGQVLHLAQKLCVPPVLVDTVVPASTNSSSATSSNGGHSTPWTAITSRHMKAIRMFLRVVACLANGLGESWETVVESLDMLDAALHRPQPSTTPTAGSTPVSSHPPVEDAADDLGAALKRFSSFSTALEDPAVSHLARALASHSEALLTAEQQQPNGASLTLVPKAAGTGVGDDPAYVPPTAPSAPAPSGPSLPISSVHSGFNSVEATVPRSLTSAAFVLKHLVRIAAVNMYRVEAVWAAVESHLCFVAMAARSAPTLRVFAVSALSDFISRALGRRQSENPETPVKVKDTGELCCAIGRTPDLSNVFRCVSLCGGDDEGHSRDPSRRTLESGRSNEWQAMLLRPLVILGAAPQPETRQHALMALHRVLQSSGHVLDGGWPCVFDLLRGVASSCEEPLLTTDSAGSTQDPADGASASNLPSGDPPPPSWGESCLPLAFTSLKLIVDDNLDSVPRRHLPDCVLCMGAFGSQMVDVNISLTAVNMVWAVADFVSGCDVVDSEVVWDVVFLELGRLALDSRPEVRNGAITTLLSCLVGHGAGLNAATWEGRIQAVLQLVQAVEEKSRSASQMHGELGGSGSLLGRQGKAKGLQVVMHHSRDTVQKQWSETRVLVMQGLGRLHRAFFRTLRSQAWYPTFWTRTLELAKAAVVVGSANTEVAQAGVTLLFTLLMLASKAGLPHAPIRAAVGMKVIDGALTVAPPVVPQLGLEAVRGSLNESAEADLGKEALWEEAWTAIKGATEYAEDQDGELAASFVTNLQAIYETSRDAELQATSRMIELLHLLKNMVEARKPRVQDTTAERRTTWKPSVMNSQREVLTFLAKVRNDSPDVWEVIYLMVMRLAAVLVTGPDARQGGEDDQYVLVPISKQFAKEAAESFTTLYTQPHPPLQAKAVVFDRIVEAWAGVCVQCSMRRRERPRREWVRLLERHASRDPHVAAVTVQSPDTYHTSAVLLLPVLKDGLEVVRLHMQAAHGPLTLLKLWGTALRAVEGYLIPWELVSGGSDSDAWTHKHGRATESGAHLAVKEVAAAEALHQLTLPSYRTLGAELLSALVRATLSSVSMSVQSQLCDSVADLLLDVVLSEGGTAGSLEGQGGESLTLVKAALGHIDTLLSALLAAVGSKPEGGVIQAARRIVYRLLHAAAWLLQRYLTESRCTDGPTNAYVVAEAHALLILDFLKRLRLPAWVLPPWGHDGRPPALENVECLEWVTDGGAHAGGGSDGRHEESRAIEEMHQLSSVQVGGCAAFSGHIFLLSPTVLACVQTGSSVIRAAITELLCEANIGGTYGALLSEIVRLRRELQHRSGLS